MRFEDLTPELFRRALHLYLERAYPDGALPPRAQIDTSRLATPQDVLALFEKETRPNPGGEQVRHYVLRLGNRRYPHMKMAFVEFVEPDEWMWSVDTHDRAPIDPSSPDWAAWQELRLHNLKVKSRVESAWRKSGIPTARVVVRHMPAVEEAGAGPLVLVVDDERGMRAAAANVLRSAGYRVVEAEDGVSAIERWLQDRPDLVLMDYEMPGMNGEEVCRRIRELAAGEERERTPVLLATAGMVPLAQHCTADGFLVKPYQRSLLLSFVKHQLPGEKG